ncbi:glycosyltransferase [Leucobacter sp. USHLN153]|uniref:glycosyltransferase n=1 Tax=Leucobacter sp. USHLN153 TaxID=3081268 RepID=UPI00301B5008
MTEPLVDLTIAVHSATRPIARAVGSVLDHTDAEVRVNVVAHNIDPAIIRENLGSFADHPRVRLLELRDGIPSPAGPMNYGFANSTAPYISVMGSDDELAPGAIDSWLAMAERTGADAVLARIRLDSGRTDPYPPVRGGRRTERLHPRKDRLAYRSAPLGLISRARFGDLRLTEGLASGEDLTYSLTVWYTARSLAYDLEGPPYVINADAGDRVTFAPRPVARDFAFLDELESLPWFACAGRHDRLAIVVKLIRIHVFDAILARARTQEDLDANRGELLALLERFERLAPGVHRLLARTDRAVFDELASAASTPESIALALDRRHVYRSIPTLLPRNPFRVLQRQAPFRTLFAGFRIMNGVEPEPQRS